MIRARARRRAVLARNVQGRRAEPPHEPLLRHEQPQVVEREPGVAALDDGARAIELAAAAAARRRDDVVEEAVRDAAAEEEQPAVHRHERVPVARERHVLQVERGGVAGGRRPHRPDVAVRRAV